MSKGDETRDAKLAEALRRNLRRRKAAAPAKPPNPLLEPPDKPSGSGSR